MRVLLVPELYRPDDATACGTLNDAVTWVEQWLALDAHLHVYWLLPPREAAGYDVGYVHADRERVTLIEAQPLAARAGDEKVLTDCGYTPAQLEALRSRIFEPGGYVDVVVDQLRGGRFALYQWLLALGDNPWAAEIRPFDVVANVHDLQLPFKYQGCGHRNGFQMGLEVTSAVLSDGVWFTAGVDREGLREYVTEFLDPGVVEVALDESVVVGSPVDFDAHEQRYADEPEWVHVAGSFWEKKHGERVLSIAERLHERFGVQTVLTSMEPIPAAYRRLPWVESHSEASRETYEHALRKGDIAVCASDYETMARTPFEQVASGQVLVARDEPWINECIPDRYPLVGELDALGDLAAWAVEHWPAAVAATRRLVEHARTVRGAGRVGGRTYRDLRRRVTSKLARFEAPQIRQIVEQTLDVVEQPVGIDTLVEATACLTDNGQPLLDRDDCTHIDLVYALRASGYVDDGRRKTPVFQRANAVDRETARSGPTVSG